MRRALPWLVLAGYLAVSVGVFFALFAAPATDDYAGWSLALPALTTMVDRDVIKEIVDLMDNLLFGCRSHE